MDNIRTKGNNILIDAEFNKSNKVKGNNVERTLEKGSIEMLLLDKSMTGENEKISLHKSIDSITKEFMQPEMKEKEELNQESKELTEALSEYSKEQFDYDALNRDLAEIEERLRITRLSWSKGSMSPSRELMSEQRCISSKDFVRKSLSMTDFDKGHHEKVPCESPAFSEGILKWDYGADIGMPQNDSDDDMEPITWPVTAEQAMKESAAKETGFANRTMKMSVSQGSFLSSPDPEDRKNLIAKVTEEYKSQMLLSAAASQMNNITDDGSISRTTKYDEKNTRQIMEQAEEAERRLRERLEAVKALHLNGVKQQQCFGKTPVNDIDEEGQLSSNEKDNQDNKELYEDLDSSCSEDNKQQSSQHSLDLPKDFGKQTYTDERSRSPASASNTGRTTTIESTHTYSDYGKAPLFNSEAYGSRKEIGKGKVGGIYSRTKDDRKDLKNYRQTFGIATDLETISSRETLQISEEKKDNSVLSEFSRKDRLSHSSVGCKQQSVQGGIEKEHSSGINRQQEPSLQAKWDHFKGLVKSDDTANLFDKSSGKLTFYQPPSARSHDEKNTHRQQSSTPTFTSLTNVSPRCDSFITDIRHYSHRHVIESPNPAYHAPTDATEKHQGERTSERKATKSDENRSSQNNTNDRYRYSYNRSRSGKRLTNGDGQDEDDDNNDKSYTEKRKSRHAATLANLKKKFGSGQLDGETTASELEHDDNFKFGSGQIEKDSLHNRLSQMLTKMSRKAAADETIADVSDVSQSSSVDTIMLMNRMSNLLGQPKPSDVNKIGRSNKSNKQKEIDNKLPSAVQYASTRPVPNEFNEQIDTVLVLKHLLLKHKVKWLADCAREESRRRKINKIQKLLLMYEKQDKIFLPSDLETETATLMGSNRTLSEDNSQSDTYSGSEDSSIPAETLIRNAKNRKRNDTNKNMPKSQISRQQYFDYARQPRKEYDAGKNKMKYPPSESWCIPLRNVSEHSNKSNACHEAISTHNCQKPCYSSPRSVSSERKPMPVNLTAKERMQLRRELEIARQRNAHECHKDIRSSNYGNTMVSNGGLSWVVESLERDQSPNHDDDYKYKVPGSKFSSDENVKDKIDGRSELQMAFERNMSDFISKSRQRQKKIQLTADERRYQTQMNIERNRLFVESKKQGTFKRRRPATQPDPLSENLYKPRRRSLSKTEMKNYSARKYEGLPEVQQKYLNERKRARIQNNRMRMQLYGEKILQRLLRSRGPWVTERN